MSWICSIILVHLPVQMIIKPVASGSKVPACPTLAALVKYLTFFTSLKDDQCSGLSNNRIAPVLRRSLSKLSTVIRKSVTLTLSSLFAETSIRLNLPFYANGIKINALIPITNMDDGFLFAGFLKF